MSIASEIKVQQDRQRKLIREFNNSKSIEEREQSSILINKFLNTGIDRAEFLQLLNYFLNADFSNFVDNDINFFKYAHKFENSKVQFINDKLIKFCLILDPNK